MAFVICEPCVGVKNGACIEVCPVDAIHPLPNETDFEVEEQLYINPASCTDCGLCAQACPQQAIFPQSSVPTEWQAYIAKNAAYFGL